MCVNNMHQIAPPQFSELAQRGGVAWLRRRNVGIVELEGQGDVADAVVVIDALSGRTMAFIGPDFPEGHRLAPINADDVCSNGLRSQCRQSGAS
jgi:hypothetical protein